MMQDTNFPENETPKPQEPPVTDAAAQGAEEGAPAQKEPQGPAPEQAPAPAQTEAADDPAKEAEPRPEEPRPPQPPYGEAPRQTAGAQGQIPPWGEGYRPPYPGQPPYPPQMGADAQYQNAYSQYHNRPAQGFSQGPAQPQSAQEPDRWDFNDYTEDDQKPKKKKGLVVFCGVLAALLVVTLASFGCYIAWQNGAFGTTANRGGTGNPNGPSLELHNAPEIEFQEPEEGEPLTTVQIARKVTPSVVGIVTYVRQNALSYAASSEGSGVIMTEDGYIISNAHLFYDKSDNLVSGVKVVTNTEEEYDAEIVGIDAKTDLAVIKIDAKDLTPAEFGNSDQLEVGESVAAVGNPGGLQFAGSVTTGVVSGLNRNIFSGYATSFIQTNAAINPGNSGGALVNAFGQVIGINSAKIMATGYEGIGFAIPINEAKPIVDDLIQNGHVKNRARIGITYSLVDETLARLNGVPQGLMVQSVDPEVDAAKKGLQEGDIITRLDGEELTDSETVTNILKDKKAGDSVVLDIYRISRTGKDPMTFQITVELAEDTGETATQYQQSPSSDEQDEDVIPWD